jgi:NCAIR mutase (PurE)-related protein
MQPDEIRKLLKKVWAQQVTVEDALKSLKLEPFRQLTHTRVDSHRALRCGFPEVIFCQGKEPAQVAEIARVILERSDVLLATRADTAAFEAIRALIPDAVYHAEARSVTVRRGEPAVPSGRVLIISAGTADRSVAEEARVTAEIMDRDVEIVLDVGVAGLHRLLAEGERILAADAIVVVAGMEGALPSVVGGLCEAPVIAVPTSVGYGASFGGLAPLLTMLNSCAAGVAVVNIDNGFGAGYMASLIAARRSPTES